MCFFFFGCRVHVIDAFRACISFHHLKSFIYSFSKPEAYVYAVSNFNNLSIGIFLFTSYIRNFRTLKLHGTVCRPLTLRKKCIISVEKLRYELLRCHSFFMKRTNQQKKSTHQTEHFETCYVYRNENIHSAIGSVVFAYGQTHIITGSPIWCNRVCFQRLKFGFSFEKCTSFVAFSMDFMATVILLWNFLIFFSLVRIITYDTACIVCYVWR